MIVNADDLGIHPRIDAGIKKGFEDGLLTSASMFVTTPYFEQSAVPIARSIGLPVGLHLSLTLGRPVADPAVVPLLVDDTGQFSLSASEILRLGRPTGRARPYYDQIRIECEAQMAAARDADLSWTHVDSHQHVHMNPTIFDFVETLAQSHGFQAIRFCREPFSAYYLTTDLAANIRRHNPAKWLVVQALCRRISPRLPTPDAYFGLYYSGNVTARVLRSGIQQLHRRGIVEVALHPGFPAPLSDDVYSNSDANAFIQSQMRQAELDAVLDDEARLLVEKLDVRLTSYAEFVGA